MTKSIYRTTYYIIDIYFTFSITTYIKDRNSQKYVSQIQYVKIKIKIILLY